VRKTCSFLLLILVLGACSAPTPTPLPTRAPARRTATLSPPPSLSPTSTPIPYRAGCVTAGSSVRLRTGPGTQFETIGRLAPKACFYAYGISEDGDWILVSFEGQQGWVSATLLSIEGDLSTLVIPITGGTPPVFATASLIPVPVETLIPTPSPSHTPGPTATLTLSPSNTPSLTLTRTPTRTPTETPTRVPTKTPTRTPTRTPTKTPTRTPTRTATAPVSPTPPLVLCSDASAYTGQSITCQIPRAFC
jgi:hypothetical protein